VILAAGLLLLIGLGLLVAGVVTGVTALYWGCVGVCLVAAVLLFVVRRQLAAARAPGATGAEPGEGRPSSPAPAGTEKAGSAPAAPAEPAIGEAAVEEAAVEEATVEEATAEEATGEAADVPAAVEPVAAGPVADGPAPVRGPLDEAPLEEVEVTDLLLVVDLHDDVLVIDEHPRYHLPGCVYLTGRTAIPLPIDEARSDGFTPCGSCEPDHHLADQVRARRAAGNS
jgi:hypothetical protein